MIIENGTGDGHKLKVDKNNQLHSFCVIESEKNAAVEDGQAFNLNTGIIALTGSSDSAIFYMKSNEAPLNGDADIVIDTIIIGINTISATITENPILTVVRNPTAGTIIDDASAVSMNSNSNFGSSNGLDSLIYKASATGKTLTDGTDHAIVLCKEGRTTIPELNIDLTKGSSIGLKLDLNTSGGANVYAAVVCHRKDGNNSRS
jgi:hypothetical protein